MGATMHWIRKPSVLLVALILVGLGKEVIGQADGVNRTFSISEEGDESSNALAIALNSTLPPDINVPETAVPLSESVAQSASEAVQFISETSTTLSPEGPTEKKNLAKAEKHTESPTNVPSTPAKPVTDPKSCDCTCPSACEISTTAATTTSDLTSTEKSESAEISTRSFREDHLSRKGSSFFVKTVVAFVIMAAIFGILIVVNLCRRHRGDISAQLREWKNNARGKQHLLGFCSRYSCCRKSTGSTPIIMFKRGKYGEEDSDLDILTESMHM